MGSAESVPSSRGRQQRSSREDLLALQEKYDGFRITEDRETDSMLVDRNTRSADTGNESSSIRSLNRQNS